MKVAELREELENLPGNAEVLVWDMGQGGLVALGGVVLEETGEAVILEPKQEEAMR